MSNYTGNSLIESNQNTAWVQAINLIHDKWTILDVGCSSGTLGEELINKKQCIVDGIEIDKSDAEIAKKKLRHVEALNVENAKNITTLFKGKYDAILLIDVIEHLVDPVAALVKLKQLLKPEGVIVFSIPNMAHVSVRLALLEGNFTYTQTGLLDKTHLHFYTGDEIQRIFMEARFKITEFTCSSLQYTPLVYEKKLQKLGLSIKKKKQFLDMIEESRGNVYQYVGLAVPSSKKITNQKAPPRVNAHEKDYKIIQDTLEANKKHIDFLQESVRLKDDHINNLEAIIEDLRHRSVTSHMKQKLKSKRQSRED